MTAVYIEGSEKAIFVATWIDDNLKNCDYDLAMDPPSTFSSRYKFSFKSNHDAAMVALKWGNSYVRV
jgi:hypothetical protein